MKDISLQDLLEAGCHFGHQVRRRHPKMAPYIYSAQDGVHIIDLVATKTGLDEALKFFQDRTSRRFQGLALLIQESYLSQYSGI